MTNHLNFVMWEAAPLDQTAETLHGDKTSVNSVAFCEASDMSCGVGRVGQCQRG